MLYDIPGVLPPKLMKIMMEMGHGDELVLADGNFPARSKNARVVRADGSGVPELLDAILRFFPLDYAVECPVAMMEKPLDYPEPPVWAEYKAILAARSREKWAIQLMPRQAFYERAARAYVIVATGERARFSNILIKKGVVRTEE